eukprot:gnl/Chilomastix_cuspidata/1525.p1 GENE.gnl/Chilomastix_cuspidata/1525~~gnl/Chilomastix_cuspidata/1525.p1  ORF type:complete len:753 (-),score=339.14 gnl/Chilomastix_cuspidata/1525:69-2327(-)
MGNVVSVSCSKREEINYSEFEWFANIAPQIEPLAGDMSLSRTPLILIPGVGGTRLKATFTDMEDGDVEPKSPGSSSKPERREFTVWPHPYRPTHAVETYLWGKYDPETRELIHFTEAVEPTPGAWENHRVLRIRPEGGRSGIEGCDSLLGGRFPDFLRQAFGYFGKLAAHLTKQWGYTEGFDLFGFPYDWRQAPHNERLLRQLHDKIVSAFRAANGLAEADSGTPREASTREDEQDAAAPDAEPKPLRKITIIAHSYGNMITQSYLKLYSRRVKGPDAPEEDTWHPYVDRFIAVAPPFDGAGASVARSPVTGYTFKMTVFDGYTFGQIESNSPGYPFLNQSGFIPSPLDCCIFVKKAKAPRAHDAASVAPSEDSGASDAEPSRDEQPKLPHSAPSSGPERTEEAAEAPSPPERSASDTPTSLASPSFKPTLTSAPYIARIFHNMIVNNPTGEQRPGATFPPPPPSSLALLTEFLEQAEDKPGIMPLSKKGLLTPWLVKKYRERCPRTFLPDDCEWEWERFSMFARDPTGFAPAAAERLRAMGLREDPYFGDLPIMQPKAGSDFFKHFYPILIPDDNPTSTDCDSSVFASAALCAQQRLFEQTPSVAAPPRHLYELFQRVVPDDELLQYIHTFGLEMWEHACETLGIDWRTCLPDDPAEFRFASISGTGVATPWHTIFDEPVADYSELFGQIPRFATIEGDGTVPLISALSDQLDEKYVDGRFILNNCGHFELMMNAQSFAIISRLLGLTGTN